MLSDLPKLRLGSINAFSVFFMCRLFSQIAKQIAAKETSMVPLMAAGLFYYIFNFLVAFVMERIEKSMNYYR